MWKHLLTCYRYQFLHHVWLCDPMNYSTPGFPVLRWLSWVCSNSWPLSRWCHPTISSYVALFFSRPQFFLASGSFPVNRLFTSGGQSIGASASVFPTNIQGWFPLGLTGLISLQSKGPQKSFPTPQFKSINSLMLSPILTSRHDHWKTIALTRWTLVGKEMSLLFNMLSRLVITLLPRNKRLLISWLRSPSVILEPRKTKSLTVSIVFPIYLPWSDGTGCHDLSFLNVEF